MKALKHNAAVNLKKGDKGNTTVILNVTKKLQEGLVQLNNRDHYLPLEKPMVTETLQKAKERISQLGIFICIYVQPNYFLLLSSKLFPKIFYHFTHFYLSPKPLRYSQVIW